MRMWKQMCLSVTILVLNFGCNGGTQDARTDTEKFRELKERIIQLEAKVAVLERAQLALASNSKAETQATTILGRFQGESGWERYQVTFLKGNTYRMVSPSNGQTFSGTYIVDEGTIVGDLGWGKEIFQIVDANTLQGEWNGTPVKLYKAE